MTYTQMIAYTECVSRQCYLIWGILGAAIFDCIIRSCELFDWFTDEQAGFQLDCGHRLKLGKRDPNILTICIFYFQIWFSELTLGSDRYST